MRYLESRKYYNSSDKSKPPCILFWAGSEASIVAFYNSSGFVTDTLAAEFGCVVLYAEHRYYGESWPFNDTEKAYNNLKYLSINQVLYDFANFIDSYKNNNTDLANAPVIAFGSSYSGMLSAWLRIKFPNVFAGSVASSSPIRMFKGLVP